jgi:hypothetical protein
VVTDGCRCKLRTGFIEDAAAIASRQQSSKHLLIPVGIPLDAVPPGRIRTGAS